MVFAKVSEKITTIRNNKQKKIIQNSKYSN